MLRALTYFESIFNGIIMIILDVGTWYDCCGLNCQKGRKKKSTGTLRHISHALDPLGFGAWHITSNQQYSFTFARNEKHSQYVFKPPYNTMQATRLLQQNNPPQNQFPISQVYIEFYKFLTRIYLLCSS